MALGGLGEARIFLVEGKAMRVLVVPVLPGPGNCEDDPFRTPPNCPDRPGTTGQVSAGLRPAYK